VKTLKGEKNVICLHFLGNSSECPMDAGICSFGIKMAHTFLEHKNQCIIFWQK
jgi:hypothetical protein